MCRTKYKAMSKYLSIRDYAHECGITTQQVYYRIKQGEIEIDKVVSKKLEGKVINILTSPPVRKKKAGRKRLSDKM